MQQEKAEQTSDAIVEAIRSYTAEHGYSPLQTELTKMTGLSERTIRNHMNRLVDAGVLVKGPGPRTVRIAD